MKRHTILAAGVLAVSALAAGAAAPAGAHPGHNLVFSFDARLAASVDPKDGTTIRDVTSNGETAHGWSGDVRYTAKTKSVTIGNKWGWNYGYRLSPNRFDFQNGITIEARADFGKTAENFERIIDLGRGLDFDNIILSRDGTSDELLFEVWHGHERVGRLTTTTSPLTPNAGWHTYTATLTTDGTPAIYIDGVEQAAEISWSFEDDVFGGLPLTVLRDSNFIGHSNWWGDTPGKLSIQYIRMFDFPEDAEVVLDHATTNSKWDSVQ